ncbi:protein phosphatase methylesterase [Saitoella complicata NRRL Y-17804]|nr:protein phosphatase methylesterase [Saitoella complicata NRRL Y-17804]ODQ51048.1 protein phosphatase methylesterase [Saitoella complicata NRRL Y-17804]
MKPTPLSALPEDGVATEQHDYSSASSDSSGVSASSASTITPADFNFRRPQRIPTSDTEPLPWSDFFAHELDLHPDPSSPSTFRMYYNPPNSITGPLFVAHHGAGSSALSFGLLASEIQRLMAGKAGFLCFDARGHGSTQVENEHDLSLLTLGDDMAAVVGAVQTKFGWEKLPDIVLVGHSLGGAVVTDLANRRLLGPAVMGVAVFDVVEGSAIEALKHMHRILEARPAGFASIAQATEWHLRTRVLRNKRSARLSVPPLLLEETSGGPKPFRWRTDLVSTSPSWSHWFLNLSSKFLSIPASKLLILAGTDRLDKPLMIGQMQGKYQLNVFPEAGHFLHEDCPERTAEVLVEFWRRNDRGALVLPKKIGEM